MARATSNGVDSQLPPALNVKTPTSGKHQQAKLALSRAEAKASEPSVIVAVDKVKENDRISYIPDVTSDFVQIACICSVTTFESAFSFSECAAIH